MTTTIKERPILFSAPMVRAILEGRKTVTRRPVKGIALEWLRPEGFTPEYTADPQNSLCPYGNPGERLWVRETWLPDPDADHEAWDEHTDTYVSWSGCGSRIDGVPPALRKPEHCIYREGWDGTDLVWRPSIHMPRWASRILLEITGVRVERLNDISEDQALAEGVERSNAKHSIEPFRNYLHPCMASGHNKSIARASFMTLWQSINGLESWDVNPWVWVVEFKRLPY
ncbi:MAG: hypothetical protein JWP42_4353 [Pseudomonas sp.]|nr:hypothetical protein [Pseudomonas sp.]